VSSAANGLRIDAKGLGHGCTPHVENDELWCVPDVDGKVKKYAAVRGPCRTDVAARLGPPAARLPSRAVTDRLAVADRGGVDGSKRFLRARSP
jgi:hypothetical protein